ncbi:putative monooxygenase (luciferase-like) [Mycolicibacterium madagascariense]|uniref:Putative monooxygenase (Luciferase-like) n=1 Tax=Mycolicibacterium madagascariense TaxID=212765 RepID=A0A7I7XA39_9MYCO|nr:LLM class flavin-dependent oxidoreductase [Mycolicibacterium madagascariense]MCV7015003.1 LLM class flavin-dependent oxidoreductase [Mycolicibacterium madagascariense]BBZ26444.1 putative monooxygenase (luciferase-like) [Mycolicibacterium madagascariense]
MNVPLSILDLSPISEGGDAASALRNTIDLARHAEQWGFRRYWLAEHHFVAVASSQPAVLIGQLAAATERIHVGAAAVQLGYTTAVATVESFGILDALYPGRIDLGVGRSGQRRREAAAGPKPDAATRPAKPPRVWREVDGVVIPAPFDISTLLNNPRLKARSSVLQQPDANAPDFGDQVADIIAMLQGTFQVDGVETHVTPGERADLWPWVFGSSKGQSARVAAKFGLPFVASYHITPATALEAVEVYRDSFQPSDALREPYVVVSADVVVADDTATAQHLASTFGNWVHQIRAVDGAVPYPDPETTEPLTAEQQELVRDRTATQFVGDPDEVAHRLDALQKLSGADELVITSVTHRHADRLRSHELIATRWGL